jgi:hypothetical protein
MFFTSGGHSDSETNTSSLITAAGQHRIYTEFSPLPLMAVPHQNQGLVVIYHARISMQIREIRIVAFRFVERSRPVQMPKVYAELFDQAKISYCRGEY